MNLIRRVRASIASSYDRAAGPPAWMQLSGLVLTFFVAATAGGLAAVLLVRPVSTPTLGLKPELDEPVPGVVAKFDPAMALDPIRGIVIDPKGQPVAGAEVFLRSRFTGSPTRHRPTPPPGVDLGRTRTDRDGRFVFQDISVPETPFRDIDRDLWTNNLDVIAISPGLATGWRHLGESAGNIIRLSPAVSLLGRVLGLGGPVAGAEVRLTHLMSMRHLGLADLALGRWPASDDGRYVNLAQAALPRIVARTASDGSFLLEGLPAGLGAVLEVDHPDHLIARIYAATTPDALEGQPRDKFKRPVQSGPLVAQLERGRHLSVEVLYEDTGKPAVNARLDCASIARATYTADKQGRIQIGQLTVGSHRLLIRPPEGAGYLDVPHALTVTQSQRDQRLQFKLPRGTSVSGRVVDAETDRGVAGVALRWNLRHAVTPHTAGKRPAQGPAATDAEGRFQIAVPLGAIGLAVAGLPDGYAFPNNPEEAQGRVIAGTGRPNDEVVLKLNRLPHWVGTVVDTEGRPVAGAEIVARSCQPHESPYFIRRRSDETGRFEFPTGRAQAPPPVIAPEALPAGAIELPNQVAVVPPILQNRVRNLPFAQVPVAPMYVVARDRGRQLAAALRVTGDPSADEPLRVQLAPVQSVQGRVVDAASGLPLRAVRVWLYTTLGEHLSSPLAAAPVRTGADGRFAITGLIPSEAYTLGPVLNGYEIVGGPSLHFVAGKSDFDAGEIRLQRVASPRPPRAAVNALKGGFEIKRP